MSRIGRPRQGIAVIAGLVVLAVSVSAAASAPHSGSRSASSHSASRSHSASVAHSTGHRSAATVADDLRAARKSVHYGIPALPVYSGDDAPSDASASYGGELGDTAAEVTRAKIIATVGKAKLLSYLQECLDIPLGGGMNIQTCCPDAFDTSTCKHADVVDAPATSVDDTGAVNWSRAVGPVWVASPHGSARRFGLFPPIRVKLLAFGAIPVTATVHLSQPLTARGEVTPLAFSYLSLFGSTTAGMTISGYSGANPADTDQFDQHLTLTGPLDLRVSDVVVDKVPLDVGPDCHTAENAKLTLNGPRGFYPVDVPAAQLVGKAGGFQPLNIDGTGSIESNLSIPRFTNCRDGASYLDPLVTAMTSGPVNSVDLTLAGALLTCDRVTCPDYPTIDKSPPATPTTASRTSSTPASSTSASSTKAKAKAKTSSSTASSAGADPTLTSAQRARLVRVVSRLPRGLRATVLRSLPARLSRAVRSRLG